MLKPRLVPSQETVLNKTLQSTPASKLAHLRTAHSPFFLSTLLRQSAVPSKPSNSVRCSAFEQNVPLGNNQGVLKQQLIPNADAINEFAKNSAALEDALELLKDIVEAKKGQQIDSHSVADVVKLLQDFQTLGQSAFAEKQKAKGASSVADSSLPGTPKVALDNGSNNPQSADTLKPGDKSNAIVVVPQPDKASLAQTTQQFFQNLLSTISGSPANSAGSLLGKGVLAAVLGGASLFGYRALPPNSLLKPPIASVVTAVPYSHFLDHVNFNVVDEIDMVGHQLLYKLKDGFAYNPGAYQPEVDLMRTAVAGVGNFLHGKQEGTPAQEVLKTTLPVGHSLPLDKLWENAVTLAAKQPGTLPKDAATFFAGLLALFVARTGGSKKPEEPQASSGTPAETVPINLLPPASTTLQPAVDVAANPPQANPPSTQNPPDGHQDPSAPAPPVSGPPPPPPTSTVPGAPVLLPTFPVLVPPPPLPAVSPPPPSSPTAPAPLNPAPVNPAIPDTPQTPPPRIPVFKFISRLFKRNEPLPPATIAGVQAPLGATADPSLPQKSEALERTAMATTGEKVGSGQDGGNPNPAAETPGVTGPDDSAKDPAALPIGLTPGSGQTATPPDPNRAPTPVTVTLKNTSAARVVVYAVNPIEDTDPAGKGQPLVAWKIVESQATASFVIGPQPPEVGAIRRESPTWVDRAGPFPTSYGAVWGLVQRSKLHTPVLKEATPMDFWYRLSQADAVTVVNVRPNEYPGRPYEFGYYQGEELLLLGKAVKTNDFVRFQAPLHYTAAVLTPEARNIRAGSVLDTGQIVDHSDLAIKVREIVDKQVAVTLTHDDATGYKWV